MIDSEHLETTCKPGRVDECRYLYAAGCNQSGTDWRCANTDSAMKEIYDNRASKDLKHPQLVNCDGQPECQIENCPGCTQCAC